MTDTVSQILYYVVVPLARAGMFLFYGYRRAARRLPIIPGDKFRTVRRSKNIDKIEQAICLCLAFACIGSAIFIIVSALGG